MNIRVRVALVGLSCLGLALIGGAMMLLKLATIRREEAARRPVPPLVKSRDLNEIIDINPIDDGGFGIVNQFTAPIHDPGSLEELRVVIEQRGRLALAVLQAESDHIRLPFRAPKEQVAEAASLLEQIGLLGLHEGRCSDAATSFQKALAIGRPGDVPERDRARRMALVGIAALQRGQAENNVADSGGLSNIFPIARQAVHARPSGSREAVQRFTAYLQEWPKDLRVRWLLNFACMTLGEYPDGVPRQYLIPLDTSGSTLDVVRFEDVAPRVGLTVRPQSGGWKCLRRFQRRRAARSLRGFI